MLSKSAVKTAVRSVPSGRPMPTVLLTFLLIAPEVIATGINRPNLLNRRFESVDWIEWYETKVPVSPPPNVEPILVAKSTEAEDDPAEFDHRIYSCRTDRGTTERHCAGNYGCPPYAPRAYSKTFKYPVTPPNDYRTFRDKGQFCVRTPVNDPVKSKRHKHPRPIPQFCENEILQLRIEMPADLSNQTALAVNWGFLGNRAAFFCPARFSTGHRTSEKYQYCLSEVCHQKLPFRTGDTKYTFGTFHEVDDTWILNLKLHESTGHWGLFVRAFSCPPLSPPDCRLWIGESYCKKCTQKPGQPCFCDYTFNDITQCSLALRPECCSYETSYDIDIIKLERNSILSPSKSVGEGFYNVTIIKNDLYDSINITDMVTGKSVEELETDFGPEMVTVTLPEGIYQVSGTTNHTCGAADLNDPIVLRAVNATLNSPEFIDFPLRKLSWSVQSDIKVLQFLLYPKDDATQQQVTTQYNTVVHIGGEEYNTPAPLEKSFVQRVSYEGIDEENEPLQTFTISLSDYTPTRFAVTYNNTHTNVQWRRPKGKTDHLAAYRLNVGRTSRNSERSFDITPGADRDQHFSYYLFQPFPAGETVKFRLGSVYRNKTNGVLWWGPETTRLVEIPETPSSNPVPSSSFISTTTSARPSASATPTDVPSSDNNALTITLSTTLPAVFIATAITAGTVISIFFCIKKTKNRSQLHNNPESENPI